LYYGWKTQKLRGFLGPLKGFTNRESSEQVFVGRDFPLKKYSADQESHVLLLFDMNGLKQFEIERRLCGQGYVAIAGESRTTGTRRRTDQCTDGSALAAASDRPDTGSSGSATAHHDGRALAFSLAGCHGSRSLNFMILPVDSDARELEDQQGAAFESARGFCFIYDSLCASTLGDGDLSFDFDGRFDGCREPVSGLAGFRTYGLIQNYSDNGVRRNDQRLRLDGFFHGILSRFRHGRRRVSVRSGLLVSRLLAPNDQPTYRKSTQRDRNETPIHQILPGAGNLCSLNIRPSVVKSIWFTQIQNDGFIAIWHVWQILCRQTCTVSGLIRRIQSCWARFAHFRITEYQENQHIEEEQVPGGERAAN
jgi:hypothetical protein